MEFLPLADVTAHDTMGLLDDVPGPCRRQVKRSIAEVATDLGDGFPQPSVRKQRRLTWKQKTVVEFTTPLRILCPPLSDRVPSLDPQDDFDLSLREMAGPPQEPLDPPEPSDEQLQVGSHT